MNGGFNLGARTVIVHAQRHARRLSHHYVGCEHLLLAAIFSDEPAGAVLRAHGLTPERVEELIVQVAGLGAGPGLFADLDSDALAAVGIDVEAVRAHVEAHVTREALARADRTVHHQTRPPGRGRPRPRAAIRLLRLWRARRTASKTAEPISLPAGATGPPPPPYIPFTPGAKKTLGRAHDEAFAHHDPHAGVEHIALALTTASTGPVPPILSAAGTTAPALRTAILDRYRQAS
jgi:ATP-dependent Clp protease ATP-binding subunit ClpA